MGPSPTPGVERASTRSPPVRLRGNLKNSCANSVALVRKMPRVKGLLTGIRRSRFDQHDRLLGKMNRLQRKTRSRSADLGPGSRDGVGLSHMKEPVTAKNLTLPWRGRAIAYGKTAQRRVTSPRARGCPGKIFGFVTNTWRVRASCTYRVSGQRSFSRRFEWVHLAPLAGRGRIAAGDPGEGAPAAATRPLWAPTKQRPLAPPLWRGPLTRSPRFARTPTSPRKRGEVSRRRHMR
jgi:hypothetical protein